MKTGNGLGNSNDFDQGGTSRPPPPSKPHDARDAIGPRSATARPASEIRVRAAIPRTDGLHNLNYPAMYPTLSALRINIFEDVTFLNSNIWRSEMVVLRTRAKCSG